MLNYKLFIITLLSITIMAMDIDEKELLLNPSPNYLFWRLYSELKNKNITAANTIINTIKKQDLSSKKLAVSEKYLYMAIEENDDFVLDYWIKNLFITQDHIICCLLKSETTTKAMLVMFQNKNREWLIKLCKIIEKENGIPKNINLYLALFSLLRKPLKIIPKEEVSGYNALKDFVEKENIYHFKN